MSVKENLEEVLCRIEKVRARAGLEQKVTLVAVSKTVDPGRIREAYEAGARAFGENRVQEMLQKQPLLPENIEWHLIGRLQKNKIKYIINKTVLVHSVCDFSQAAEIDRLSKKQGIVTKCLIQVNIGREESKAGVDKDELFSFIRRLSEFQNIRIEGLMAIPPPGTEAEDSRVYFREMRRLYENLPEQENVARKWLSMGMSQDYEAAVEEGANMVRVGSYIFGKRS